MAIVPPVFEILSATAAVTALVPAIRIRGQGYAGETPVAPYITWQVVSGLPENYTSNRPGIDQHRVQVDCWATTAAQSRAIATAVRNALEPHGQCVAVFGDDYDTEARLYRFGFDWSIWSNR
jgi:hypothetical protein